jgi:hypothetical protein
MRYNTGNPVEPNGSSDPRDLYDNAGIIDLYATSDDLSVPDRTGKERLTYAGLEDQVAQFLLRSGYESVFVIYAAAAVVQRPTQLVQRGEELYRAINQADLPLTLTGTWATDAPKLVAVGDAYLRQGLALPNGSTMVGHGPGTVKKALDDLVAAVDETNGQLLQVYSTDLDPATIPMHFGVLRGRGWTAGDPPWNAGDPQNVKITTATGAVGTASTDIPVASSTNFAGGMLICYLATDGEYYSAKLHQVLAGPIFRLGETLPAPIANGAPIYNFYRDDAHPNTYGGATIVDDALRRLEEFRIKELELRVRDGAFWESLSGAAVTQLSSVSYENPGSLAVGERGVDVSSSTPGAGVKSRWMSLTGGDYVAEVPLNVGIRTGGFSGFVEVYVDEFTTDGAQQTIASSGPLSGYNSIRLLELKFSCRPGSMISIRAVSASSGGWTFYVGPLNLYKLGARVAEVNRGKHVLLGDSWFSVGSAMATRFTERLNKASVVVKGVGGNRAGQLIDRFMADVASENPDYVWVMVGTNDVYGGTTPELFEQQILQLRRMIQAIGAQAIFFDCSVCAITYSPSERLSGSRQYRIQVRYEDIASQSEGASAIQRSANFSGQVALNAGATVLIGVCPALTRSSAVLRTAILNQSNLRVVIDYPTTPDGAGTVDAIWFPGAIIRDQPAIRTTDTAPRLVAVRLLNPTAGVVNVSYAIDVCWNQTL